MLKRIVLRETATSQWLIFSKPLRVLLARRSADVLPVLVEAERRVREENLYAAGFVSFEAASGFEPSFVTHTQSRLPLICFGIFSEPERSDRIEVGSACCQIPDKKPGFRETISCRCRVFGSKRCLLRPLTDRFPCNTGRVHICIVRTLHNVRTVAKVWQASVTRPAVKNA